MTLDINYNITNPRKVDQLLEAAIEDLQAAPGGNVDNLSKVGANFLLNQTWNVIDPVTDSSIITAPGTLGNPNFIGSKTATPATSTTIHSWAVDSAYVDGASALATINGGYDSVCNQLGGHISQGLHSYIQYNADGHSSILSGSYQWIKAGRACSIAGTQIEVDTAAQFGLHGNGRFNKLGGQFSTVLNGQSAQALGTGSVVLYGDAVSATGVGSVILSAADSVCAGTYGLLSGTITAVDSGSAYAYSSGSNNNLYNAYSSFVHGTGNGAQNPGGVVFADSSFIFGRGLALGREIHHNQPGALYLSNNKLARQGDNGSFTVHGGLRTTNASPANMNVSIAPTSQLAVPDNASWAVDILVNATNEDTLAINTWSVRVDLKRLNGTLAVVSAATVTARAAEMALGLSAAVSSSTGLFRLSCTGIAATNILWTARFTVVETRGIWSDTFTADATTNDITLITTAKALQPGERVRVSNSGGALPAGLLAATDYYVQTAVYYGANVFKLATTPSGVKTLVTASTVNGISFERTTIVSSVVDITDVGTGTQTITRF